MDFYAMLADHYDTIFEVTDDEIAFLIKHAGDKNKRLLDIACGAGQYTIALRSVGYMDIEAIDLDLSMISKAKTKMPDIDFKTGSMLELDKYYTGVFDFIYCIGNSIAHLHDLYEIRSFLKNIHDILSPEGHVAIQIINYDRILSGKITSLPSISRSGRIFKRNYTLKDDKVIFTGILETENERSESSVDLLAIRYNDLTGIMDDTGFKDIQTYGSFSGKEYIKEDSYVLIVCANKS